MDTHGSSRDLDHCQLRRGPFSFTSFSFPPACVSSQNVLSLEISNSKWWQIEVEERLATSLCSVVLGEQYTFSLTQADGVLYDYCHLMKNHLLIGRLCYFMHRNKGIRMVASLPICMWFHKKKYLELVSTTRLGCRLGLLLPCLPNCVDASLWERGSRYNLSVSSSTVCAITSQVCFLSQWL